MLNTQGGEIKFSEYAVLYDMLIPADNKYRLIQSWTVATQNALFHVATVVQIVHFEWF